MDTNTAPTARLCTFHGVNACGSPEHGVLEACTNGRTEPVEFLPVTFGPAGGEFAVWIDTVGEVARTSNEALAVQLVEHLSTVPTFAVDAGLDVAEFAGQVMGMLLTQRTLAGFAAL